MASSLPPEQRASYSAIIDSILSGADLDTISAKAIRKGLQEKVDYDLSTQKKAITDLIMERFDKVQREREQVQPAPAPEPAPSANGATKAAPKREHSTNGGAQQSGSSPSKKRKTSDDEDEDDNLSEDQPSPPPKKMKQIKPEAESDEQMAKRLQAEFSAAGARATRGGGATIKKKKSASKKDKVKKKKSATKVRSDDDSDSSSGSSNEDGATPKPEKEKKGGFHKPLNLSVPLQELLGAAQLSRPETVKRIWAYVKERDLQDPSDKRQIRCDDAMRAVFKSDRVHMFTMNKILATQLYPVEE